MAPKKRNPIGLDQFNLAVQQMIKGKTDREMAILGGAVLEGMLYDLLSQTLVDSPYQSRALLFKFGQPLQHFGGMLSLAFAFGIISEEEYSLSNVIQRIRNHAAHSLGLHDGDEFAFSTPPVRDLIFEFYPKFAMQSVPKEVHDQIVADFDRQMDYDPRLVYRTFFCNAALSLFCRKETTEPLAPALKINADVRDDNVSQEDEEGGSDTPPIGATEP